MVALAGLRGCLRTICVGVADPNSALLLSLSLCRSSVSAETATPEKSSPAKPCTKVCTLRPGSAVVSVGSKSHIQENLFDSGAKPFETGREHSIPCSHTHALGLLQGPRLQVLREEAGWRRQRGANLLE